MHKINTIQILSDELLQKSVSKCIYGKIQSSLQYWALLQDTKHCLLCLETQNHLTSVHKPQELC